VKPTVFTWMRNGNRSRKHSRYGAMVCNLLSIGSKKCTTRSFSYGLRNIIGPFDLCSRRILPETPVRRTPKLDNFTMLRDRNFCSSNPRRIYLGIHRSHVRASRWELNEYGTTLAVYASICKRKELLSFGQDQQHSGMAYLM
jgi:hypothetical protein